MSPTSELPLYVAAGGGGDVLGALMVAIGEGRAPESLHIATFAWERKRFDPRLGPRAVDDFRDLRAPADDVWQVTPASRLRSGRSFLPALVSAARCNLYLLDPTRGVCGLRRQLAALGDYLGAEITVLVDVGGDILAEGGESGLRSPTADAMALAAAYGTSRPSSVLVLGLGLDGELTRAQWRAACGSAADARREPEPVTSLQASAADFIRPLLDWHPSEVAGLACLAALGYRGNAEVRADGLQVRVDRHAAGVHSFEHSWVMARNRVAQAVSDTCCLAEVEAAVRATVGRSEFDEERDVLARRERYRTQWLTAEELQVLELRLLAYSELASERQVRFLTLRRVSELLGLSPRPFRQLRKHLLARHPERLEPPVWRCER
jgi:hypothetical protein